MSSNISFFIQIKKRGNRKHTHKRKRNWMDYTALQKLSSSRNVEFSLRMAILRPQQNMYKKVLRIPFVCIYKFLLHLINTHKNNK